MIFSSSILESVPVVEIIPVDTFEACTHEVRKYFVYTKQQKNTYFRHVPYLLV